MDQPSAIAAVGHPSVTAAGRERTWGSRRVRDHRAKRIVDGQCSDEKHLLPTVSFIFSG
jgi:hypothetical protein